MAPETNPAMRIELRALVRRQATNVFFAVLTTLLSAVAVLVLFLIFGHTLLKGFGALDPQFFTQLPKPFGEEGGGIAQAILGSLMMLVLAGAAAIPIGIGTAVYLSEYGRGGAFSTLVRTSLELLAELPSIVVGVFVWAVLVRLTSYSGLAGAVALAVIMIPIIAKSVEEILHLVPDDLREAGLALGLTRWRVVLKVVIPTVLPGIMTGVVLSLARAAGETAPLLLTALGNTFINVDLSKPMAAIPLQIYAYAISPYDDWHAKAWGATLILIALVAILSAAVRIYTGRRRGVSR